jgi:hypothetical protein
MRQKSRSYKLLEVVRICRNVYELNTRAFLVASKKIAKLNFERLEKLKQPTIISQLSTN